MPSLLFQLLTSLLLSQPTHTESCDVAGFYKSSDVPYGAVAVTTLGEFVELEEVFLPTKVDPGTYSVSVTRKGSNFYRLDGGGLYVKTRLCLELAFGQDATLRVQNIGGYSIGELIFNE